MLYLDIVFCSVSVFYDEDVEQFPAIDCLVQYVQFVDNLAASGLLAENNHAMLSHCVWDFFDVVSL